MLSYLSLGSGGGVGGGGGGGTSSYLYQKETTTYKSGGGGGSGGVSGGGSGGGGGGGSSYNMAYGESTTADYDMATPANYTSNTLSSSMGSGLGGGGGTLGGSNTMSNTMSKSGYNTMSSYSYQVRSRCPLFSVISWFVCFLSLRCFLYVCHLFVDIKAWLIL